MNTRNFLKLIGLAAFAPAANVLVPVAPAAALLRSPRLPMFEQEVGWDRPLTTVVILGSPKSGKTALRVALACDMARRGGRSWALEDALKSADEETFLKWRSAEEKEVPGLRLVAVEHCASRRMLRRTPHLFEKYHTDVCLFVRRLADPRYAIVKVIKNRYGPTFRFGFDTVAMVQV